MWNQSMEEVLGNVQAPKLREMAKVFGYTTSESIAMRTQGSRVKTNKANQF